MTLNESKFSAKNNGFKGHVNISMPPTESILDNLSSGFFIIDSNWSITYLNKSMEQWVRKKREDLLGYNIWDVLPDAFGTNFYYFYHKVMEEQISVTFEDYYEPTQEWLKVTAEPFNEGIIGYVTNITENKMKEQTINHITSHDYLTGLPNRNMLNKRLSNELTLASEKKQSMAVLFIDLDRFKLINDLLGHNIGDLLLKEVTQRLETSVYSQDIIFRSGGDEFIVILADSDSNEVVKAARQILDNFATPFNIKGNEIFMTLSIGISQFPDDGKTVETLIKHADFAMHEAKKAGRNNYKFYFSNKHEIGINPLLMEMELHKAIEHEQFLLHFQPKINLITGIIVGVEALIRWEHPIWGMVSPGTFIPIAEETGLIIPIGEWALFAACKQNKEWQKQGFSTVVSVNLSPRQFTQSNLVKMIDTVLQKTGLEPRYLEVEITESMTCDIEHTISTLQQLKKLGVRVSIDDFGTGFSSLYYLKKLPIDSLKIAKSFVRELRNNPNDETIVKTIISMAHNLNLNVVAKGIETKEQLVFLQQHLCNEGQGFFFSKPLSANELTLKHSEIQQIVPIHGIPQDINEQIWVQELLNLAKKELQDTVRLQQGMIFKFKKIKERFIHSLCDGELLYRFGMIPTQVVGKELHEFLPNENALNRTIYYKMAWEGEESVTIEDELYGIHYLTILRPIKQGGEVIDVIGSSVDITDRKKAENALSKTEKLAVVGELAAGVAHEIRNPITSIKGFIQLVQQGMIKPEFFDIIFQEFNRIEDILKEFINLAKPQEIQLKKTNLKTVINDVETLLKSEPNLKNVQIFQAYIQPLPQIMCDINQIKQVLINLVKNSIEAIINGGIVKIQGSTEKENVLIKIIDNGIGISEERLSRLGEPFYSNKEKGTGLGLMLCFRIIRQHNGTITVKSIENQGTTVEVRLPISFQK